MSIVMFCGAKPASSVGNETLDVTTVPSSLTSVVQLNNNWVEFRGAEAKSLNLCAVNTSAPPCHMGAGNGLVGNCLCAALWYMDHMPRTLPNSLVCIQLDGWVFTTP